MLVARLSFGEEFPGVINPLDGLTKIYPEGLKRVIYNLLVVPTDYISSHGEKIITNQYSFTLHEVIVDLSGTTFWQPGIFFMYDISPYMITHRHTRIPFTHFITKLCAILGGIFVSAGLLSSAIYHLPKKLGNITTQRRRVEW